MNRLTCWLASLLWTPLVAATLVVRTIVEAVRGPFKGGGR